MHLGNRQPPFFGIYLTNLYEYLYLYLAYYLMKMSFCDLTIYHQSRWTCAVKPYLRYYEIQAARIFLRTLATDDHTLAAHVSFAAGHHPVSYGSGYTHSDHQHFGHCYYIYPAASGSLVSGHQTRHMEPDDQLFLSIDFRQYALLGRHHHPEDTGHLLEGPEGFSPFHAFFISRTMVCYYCVCLAPLYIGFCFC